MPGEQAAVGKVRRAVLAAVLLAAAWAAAAPSLAQVSERAEPVTGPGVTTIGGIAPGSRVNLRSGPSPLFPVVGTLGYGTRVNKGSCIGGGSARWCRVETMDGKVSGYVAGRFLVDGSAPPPDDSLAGGPDYWMVSGLGPGDRLNVRLEPTPASPALATLRNGEIVRNRGCRMAGGRRWCRVRSTTGVDVTGWVVGRYLREAAAPPGGGGGTGFSVVTGLAAGDSLNVRSRPDTGSSVIARLAQGARVRNLGCETVGSSRWCRIRTTGGVEVTGWVNGRYLRDG